MVFSECMLDSLTTVDKRQVAEKRWHWQAFYRSTSSALCTPILVWTNSSTAIVQPRLSGHLFQSTHAVVLDKWNVQITEVLTFFSSFSMKRLLYRPPKVFIKASLFVISSIFQPTNMLSAFIQQLPHPLNTNNHTLYTYAHKYTAGQERVRIIKLNRYRYLRLHYTVLP